MVQVVTAYIALGSNLRDPMAQMHRAASVLDQLAHDGAVRRSPLYRSAPLGPVEQADYLNAVAALETTLTAESLLDAVQAIEHDQGRVRQVRWGPRTLDLDILLYGDRVQNTERLILPHPGLHERAFVLYPLWDIAPTLVVPGLGPLRTLLEQCPPLRLERLADVW
ncbi:MAG: 2-amino-4-hydroxy-6-hydroxymethyldihydropteridine diphosphokinase [Gammaproteobacteria bacterium]|nr:2-amino-4-hydroxy-6-hydroxymethyldihydropteridine diphosphokinase [Gammaproteobacteria bacterium]